MNNLTKIPHLPNTPLPKDPLAICALRRQKCLPVREQIRYIEGIIDKPRLIRQRGMYWKN